MLRKLSLVVLTALAMAVTSVPAQVSRAQDTLKIGLLTDKTGALAIYGVELSNGFNLGLQYATGGKMEVAGRKIEVVERDNAGKPETAVSQARTDNRRKEETMTMTTMENLPEVVSQQEWLAARKELLLKEKELTRLRTRVNAERRRLPMVRIDKPYTFQGPNGTASLLDLFEGRQQLVMHHFMWMFDMDADGNEHPCDTGCPSCSSAADQIPSNWPKAPPAIESNRLSVSNCRRMRARPAPRASRTAISLCRTVARARSKCARLAQAMKRTNAAMPAKKVIGRVRLRTRSVFPWLPSARKIRLRECSGMSCWSCSARTSKAT